MANSETTGIPTAPPIPTEVIRRRAISLSSLCQEVAEKCLYLLVFALPLVFYPGAFWPFDTPKVVLLRILTIVILGAWVGKGLGAGEFKIARPTVVLPVLAYLGIFTLTTFTSISPSQSFFGDGGRNDGLLTIANFILLYFLVPNVLGSSRKLNSCLDLVLLGGAVVSVVGILQYLGIYWPDWLPPMAGRASSTFGNTDFLFSYLSLLIPVAAGVMIKRRRYALVFLVMLVCIILTLPSAARQLPEGASPLRVEPGTILRAAPETLGSSMFYRLRDWQTVLYTIRDRPLLGSGPNTLKHTVTLYETPEKISPDERLDKAHNEFLEAASTMGLIGLAVCLWLLLALGWRLWRTLRAKWGGAQAPLAAGLLLGFLAYVGQSNLVFHTVTAYMMFWVVLALGLAITRHEEPAFITWRFPLPKAALDMAAFLGLALVLWLSYLSVRPLVADIYFLQAEKSPNQTTAEVMEKMLIGDKVLQYNGYEPLYNTTYIVDLAEASNHVREPELKAGILGRAIDRANVAVGMSPYDANLYFVRALVRFLGEPSAETAIVHDLKKALELYPYYYQANLMLAEMEKKRGNYPQAIAARQLALQVVPDNGRVVFALGDDYFMAGDFTKAIEIWEKASLLIPDEPRVYVGLGRAYEKKGDWEKARQSYEKASGLKPDFPGLAQALQRLQGTVGGR